jgi:hypothetical protein
MGFVQPIWVVLTWSGFVILKKITLICQLFYFMLIKIGQFGNFQPIRNPKEKKKVNSVLRYPYAYIYIYIYTYVAILSV